MCEPRGISLDPATAAGSQLAPQLFQCPLCNVGRATTAINCPLSAHLAHRRPREFLRKVLDYNLRDGVAEKIRCPTLVCDAEDDLYLGGQAGELFSHLTCKKTTLRFTKAEGAGAHCEMGAGRLAFARIFDWLDETLAPG
jgi:hypothetical protein